MADPKAPPMPPHTPRPPLASEPRRLLVVLSKEQRETLYELMSEITLHMLDRVEFVSHAPMETTSVNVQPAGPSEDVQKLYHDAAQDVQKWSTTMLKNLKTVLVSAKEDKSIVDAREKRRQLLERLKAAGSDAHTAYNLGEAKVEGSDQQSAGESPTQPSDSDTKSDPDPQHGPGGMVKLEDKTPSKSQRQHSFPADAIGDTAILRTKTLYPSLKSPLATALTPREKQEVLSALLLLCLADGKYNAHDRVLLCHLCASLGVPLAVLAREECATAEMLMMAKSASMKDGANKETQDKRKSDSKVARYFKVGLASVAGAAVVGITGGLAAPVVAGALGGVLGGIGLGGVASFLGLFWMNGALIGTLFGVYGAKLGGEAMDAYAKEVEDFAFLPIKTNAKNSAVDKLMDEDEDEDEDKDAKGTAREKLANGEAGDADDSELERHRLRITIGVNGIIVAPEDITLPWETLPPETEVHALRYERATLLSLGKSLNSIVKTVAWKMVRGEILKRTVLVSISAALWPPFLIGSAATNLDNPFSRAKNRSDKAGQVLADALEAHVQGHRPVTLVGFSLGARVVAKCLHQLAERRVFGVVEDAVLIGAPIPSDVEFWAKMRLVCAGRIVNVFSSSDIVLGFLYRTHSIQYGIAGLQKITAEKVENIDVSDEVDGHLKYPNAMAKILTRCGFQGIMDGEGKIEMGHDDGEGEEEGEGEGEGEGGGEVETAAEVVDEKDKKESHESGKMTAKTADTQVQTLNKSIEEQEKNKEEENDDDDNDNDDDEEDGDEDEEEEAEEEEDEDEEEDDEDQDEDDDEEEEEEEEEEEDDDNDNGNKHDNGNDISTRKDNKRIVANTKNMEEELSKAANQATKDLANLGIRKEENQDAKATAKSNPKKKGIKSDTK